MLLSHSEAAFAPSGEAAFPPAVAVTVDAEAKAEAAALSQAREHLRRMHVRPSSGRLYVLQLLAASPRSRMGVEDVYQAMLTREQKLSLASVYRVMKDLTQEGVLQRSWNMDGDDVKYLYWIRSAPQTGASLPSSWLSPSSSSGLSSQATVGHCRMVCVHCQRTVMLESGTLEEELLRQGERAGLSPAAAPLTVHITCSDCAAGSKPG
jgi:Fur family ferric uptake transcriptional regulator